MTDDFVPPRRLTMLRMGHCDFCGFMDGRRTKTDMVDRAHLLGWQHCLDEQCQQKLEQAKHSCVIPKAVLEYRFGKYPAIRRSSGALESGPWVFMGSAFAFEPDVFAVDVFRSDEDDDLTKTVTLAQLADWQSQFKGSSQSDPPTSRHDHQ